MLNSRELKIIFCVGRHILHRINAYCYHIQFFSPKYYAIKLTFMKLVEPLDRIVEQDKTPLEVL